VYQPGGWYTDTAAEPLKLPSRRSAGDERLAVAYLRVSTEEQQLGLDAQRRAIEAWALRTGTAIAEWHLDQGLSGALPLDQRPGLLAALAAVATRRAGVLVVARRDRLARDVVTAALADRVAARSGARVLSAAGEGTDTPADDPSGFLLRGMTDLLAQYERALIALRTRAALRAKRHRGERAGTVPFGYRSDAAGRLTEDHREQEVLRRVRQLREEGLSLRAIVHRMAEEGVVGRTGRPLALRQVARVEARSRAGGAP
jgi:DNA invertase Pin-like site-specific DNA recombinase